MLSSSVTLSVCVYGGGNRREQVMTVRKGVEIIVATPGRLNDLINCEIIDVKSVTYLVSGQHAKVVAGRRSQVQMHPKPWGQELNVG